MTERLGRRLALLVVAVAASLVLAAPATAGDPGPAVFPPQASPFGHTYGEWSALWWQQALAVHSAQHPNPFDAGVVPCNLGTRDVTFLVGTTGGTVVRACTIRAGQAIFFPLINGECSEIEGNGTTKEELSSCAAAQADEFAMLHASVDGRPIIGLSRFRVQSPVFRFQSFPDNPFGVTATPPNQPSASVSDGYWVMLYPLRPGLHLIRFGGAAPRFGFSTTATYIVLVTPGHGG